MALRKIILKDDEILRKKSRPVTDFGEKTAQLLDDMKQTLIEAEGVGLAAPQVAILRRAVIIVRNEEYVELLNPEITWKSEEEAGTFEGCLSCPDQRGYVMRPEKVKVKAQDRHGEWFELECEDMAARAAQHEIDHLDGILFLDRTDIVMTDEELDELIEKEAEEEERKAKRRRR